MNDKSNPSIVIVGNCLVMSFANTLQRLNPSIDVQPWHLGEWPAGEPEDIIPALRAFDILIISLPHSMLTGVLALEELRKIIPQVVHVPPFVFSGFHPDCVALIDSDTKQVVPSPFRQHHSQIVAASFALGLKERRVSRLFNSYVFESLGYFDAYATSINYLSEQFRASGIDLDSCIKKWLKNIGAFMWIPTHPHIEVFYDISNLLLEKMGLASDYKSQPEFMIDSLEADIQFPVFPELARRLGIKGGTSLLQSTLHVAPGQSREIQLNTWISTLYSFYRNTDIPKIEKFLPGWIIEKLDSILVKDQAELRIS